MLSDIKIYLAQIDLTVGDIDGNYQKIITEFKQAETQKADLIIFPEMAITGYMAEDLWLKKYFLEKVEKKIAELALATITSKTAILVGGPHLFAKDTKKETLYNSVFFIAEGQIKKIINKKSLPNYGVFDDKRYFGSETILSTIDLKDFRLAILICEDMWLAQNIYLLKERHLDAIISVNSSPYSINKYQERLDKAQKFIKEIARPLIYLNQIGGQDSIVFDGSSFALKSNGELLLNLAEFAEDRASIELLKKSDDLIDITSNKKSTDISTALSRNYSAIILGLRDYVYKNNFKKVLIGLSGGVDSALVAIIAADALGPKNVSLYALPSRYNSNESLIDAKQLASNLGIDLKIISIEPAFNAFLSSLEPEFKDLEADISEENLQARIRGNILMALSNKFGHLLLTTGNKSELATGYATLYGDMCGGFNPIKDLYKSEVFAISKWRNQNIPDISAYNEKNLMPQNIIDKPPSAELRFNQKDSDSLPDYQILDQILFALIEEQKSINQITNQGFDSNIVKKVAKLLHFSEYKRRQSAPGVKLSNMSFDKDRRYPITNKFYE
jgi:NAD+ synthase